MKKQPAYLMLYGKLRGQITEGIYHTGDRLPSKRAMADQEEVSVITVEHAYGLLEDEGYIEARERSGYYVIYQSGLFYAGSESAAPKKMSSADGFRLPDPPVPDARGAKRRDMPRVPAKEQAGEEGYFPFPTFARAMRKVLSEYGEKILVKGENFGTAELRGVLTSYLARSRGIVVGPEQIVIGAGAEYLYGLVVQMIGRSRTYALEDPSYNKIRKVYEANGAVCEMLAMGEDGIRSEELRATKAGVLHVTPFHSYPTGITADASKRREYLEWAAAREAVIVEDDYDSEFTLRNKNIETLFALGTASQSYPNPVIYINTFSKTIAPSMRLGYMILPKTRCEEWKEKISFYSCTVSVFEQYVLAEFIRSGEFERHINRVRRRLRKNLVEMQSSDGIINE